MSTSRNLYRQAQLLQAREVERILTHPPQQDIFTDMHVSQQATIVLVRNSVDSPRRLAEQWQPHATAVWRQAGAAPAPPFPTPGPAALPPVLGLRAMP